MNAVDILAVWELSSCVPGEFYDRGALFDNFDEMTRAMQRELVAGRVAMVELRQMSLAEWQACPMLPDDELEQVPPIRADEA